MNAKSPAEIARETIEILYATGDVSILDQHPGMESVRKTFPTFSAAFPDIKPELQQQVVEGDRVASLWIYQGTHLGNLYGIPASGKAVRFQSINVVKVKDGKIVQYNGEIGWLVIFMQIGFLPLQNEK